ncbi:MAG TPA: LytR C-terminal domain-containing protein [Gemmatimonadaceae bacterium]|nr:LytR C-terminal domain-containing protein [Gemmatimonadaceae bacterium]
MERPALTRRVLLAVGGVILLAAILGIGWTMTAPIRGGFLTADRPPRPLVPEGTRIRVEVLNATSTRGLARRAMLYLRDMGFDVVAMGTAREQLDTTLVLDHAGNPEWARLVAEALGGARIEERPDTSRYLDISVLLGASWVPPAHPFYP